MITFNTSIQKNVIFNDNIIKNYFRFFVTLICLLNMVNQKGKFRWLEEGDGEQPIILLHGLMGGVENFGEMVDYISEKYKVYGLDLKLFEGRNLLKVSVKSLSDYLNDFIYH